MTECKRTDDNADDYRTGESLLQGWACTTREAKLERACMALMEQLNSLHTEFHDQDLEAELHNEDVFCGCADAYRMGHEALKR